VTMASVILMLVVVGADLDLVCYWAFVGIMTESYWKESVMNSLAQEREA
jgi:hypothetical protein